MIFQPPAIPERFNMARYFLEERLEEGRGGRVAIVDDEGRYTYDEVNRLAEQVARALWEEGVREEDRVLIALADSVEFAAAFFGVLKLGAVVAMVNPRLPDEDYDYYLAYTRARALLVEGDLATRLEATIARHRHRLRLVLTARGAIPGGRTFADLRAGAPGFVTADTSKDDPAVWLFTSGSTGKPKAALHLHHDFPWNTECYAKGVLGLREDDVGVAVPKLFFGYATGSNLMFPFAVGAKAVLFRDHPTPERIAELVAAHRATMLTAVPTMLNKLVQHGEGRSDNPLATLRLCISAGEALPEALSRRFTERFGVEILDGIGSAEMFHIYISNRAGRVRPGSLGELVPGYRARIVGDDGADLPDGEIGQLWVAGDSAAICYVGAHEKSKQVLRGDWVVSGDLFRRDSDGYFYYSGRGDDLLKVGGIFVAPTEVEACLALHPAVQEVAVVGEEDEAGLVKPLAFVVVATGHDGGDPLAAAILEHARARLAHYKVPRQIEFVAALPRSDRGKVLRRALRRP